jgi:hypothetical protein
MVFQVSANGVCLVGWHRKNITKATTAVGPLLASALWLVHCRVRIDLCGPNGNNERTCCWKNRAESASALDSVRISGLFNIYREMLP